MRYRNGIASVHILNVRVIDIYGFLNYRISGRLDIIVFIRLVSGKPERVLHSSAGKLDFRCNVAAGDKYRKRIGDDNRGKTVFNRCLGYLVTVRFKIKTRKNARRRTV